VLNPAGVTSERILMLAADNPAITQSFILSLDYKIEQAGPGISDHKVYADLLWGSAKGNGRADIDICHGTRVTLEGSYLTVSVRMTFVNGGPIVRVYASIGDGNVGKGPQLTFTADTTQLAIGANAIYGVSSYAREVEIQSDFSPLLPIIPTFLIEFLSAPVIGAVAISRHIGTDTRIAIPNGCEGIRIVNNGPGVNRFTPIFHLAL
jgi:hypothetical protein